MFLEKALLKVQPNPNVNYVQELAKLVQIVRMLFQTKVFEVRKAQNREVPASQCFKLARKIKKIAAEISISTVQDIEKTIVYPVQYPSSLSHKRLCNCDLEG
jgi:hypothetical protein